MQAWYVLCAHSPVFMFRRLLYHMKGIVPHASPSLPCWPSCPSPRLLPLSSQPINQKCIKSKVGPIKDRIPPRTVDKAYLINKCFSIRAGPRLPPCPRSFLWYLIIPPTNTMPLPLMLLSYQPWSTFYWWTTDTRPGFYTTHWTRALKNQANLLIKKASLLGF